MPLPEKKHSVKRGERDMYVRHGYKNWNYFVKRVTMLRENCFKKIKIQKGGKIPSLQIYHHKSAIHQGISKAKLTWKLANNWRTR